MKDAGFPLLVRTLFLVGAVAGLVLVTLGAQLTQAQAWVTFSNGTKVSVEMADTEAKRERGLMFRERLARDRGMIFLFEQPGRYSFWM